MALENKKSLLQPSSIESQQFRLQFSNLAPTGVVPGTTPAGTSAPVTRTGGLAAPANPAPAASLFVQAPAPVSLAAPPVIPPVVPAPVVVEAPGAVEIPRFFEKAAFFDGATALSASISDTYDLSFNGTSGNDITISLHFKPALLDSATKQTILHTYSGSVEDNSFELYLQNGKLFGMFRASSDSTTEYSFYSNLNTAKQDGKAYNLENNYTFYQVRISRNTYQITQNIKLSASTQLGDGNLVATKGTAHKTVDISNNTHFYVGGSPENGTYFSGSIAAILLQENINGVYMTNADWGDLALRAKDPESITPQLRTYTFDNALTEYTGSQAAELLPLLLATGSLSYVDGYVER